MRGHAHAHPALHDRQKPVMPQLQRLQAGGGKLLEQRVDRGHKALEMGPLSSDSNPVVIDIDQ
ncbi:MAG: hypothetical protein WCA12_00755 [Burkholderiales bacterium]